MGEGGERGGEGKVREEKRRGGKEGRPSFFIFNI